MIASNYYNNRNNTYLKHSTITFEPIYTEQYIIKIQKHSSNVLHDYYTNKILVTNDDNIDKIIKPYYSPHKWYQKIIMLLSAL